jgi:hypothetical protein
MYSLIRPFKQNSVALTAEAFARVKVNVVKICLALNEFTYKASWQSRRANGDYKNGESDFVTGH